MQKYKTIRDFPDSSGVMPILESVVTAIPPFFSITLFILWLFGAASSYFIILKTTGKRRWWHALTAMSFVCFIASLIIAAMNTPTTTFLEGYWVGFYVLAILGSYFMLSNYK